VKLALVVVALASALLSVNAQAAELGTRAEEHPYRSPQNAALELRFGPYQPQIDKDYSAKPYDKSLGSGPRVYAGLELDWQVYRIPHFGTIGPGFQVGRANMTRTSTTGADYELTIYPLVVDAVLRVDQLWRGMGVPVMPYVKGGFGIGFWEASTDFRKAVGNLDSSGRSYGGMGAIGIAFPLDFIDPDSSRGTDRAMGINTSSFFFEYDFLELGGGHNLRVGDETWIIGLMFEL
jgi:hypothetical protein